MQIKYCRNCFSKKIYKVFSLGNIYFTGKFLKRKKNPRKGPINVVMCKNCELVQLGNNFDIKYLYGPDYGYQTGINATMTEHVKKVARVLSKKTKIKRNEMALDIASNDGTLLNFYSKNITTFGMDPLVKKFESNYKKIDYKISDFFSAIKIKKITRKKFKIITALSVFYDLLNPNKFLNDVNEILDDSGIFLLEFADLASIIKFNMFDTFCHEHLEYYSLKVISKMCKKNDLRIFDIKTNSINGGSIQLFICKKSANYKNNNTPINRAFSFERKLKLHKKETYIKFFKKIKKIKKQTFNFIQKAKNKNKTIHCYGASTKGNVLLQYFKLNNKMISHVAERNPKKYNLYTPGSRIQIISESQSRKMLPDYYLVLPWHFKKEILIREKKTIKNGSKFIFPLPKFTVEG
tara:strand:+ start:1619 stop:2839 length:1221 start_codon:yes stop_codon:yes gene_type:complete